jgi:hypothetical protein
MRLYIRRHMIFFLGWGGGGLLETKMTAEGEGPKGPSASSPLKRRCPRVLR